MFVFTPFRRLYLAGKFKLDFLVSGGIHHFGHKELYIAVGINSTIVHTCTGRGFEGFKYDSARLCQGPQHLPNS